MRYFAGILACIAFVLQTLIAPIMSVAQQRIALCIDAVADDAVGKSFVYDLKEEIGHSASYRYVSSEADTEGISLSIVTLSDEHENQNNLTASVSVVLGLKRKDQVWPVMLNQWVLHVGRSTTREAARRMLANVDHDLDEIRRELNRR
jgi:hypothetical protein